MNKEKLRIAFNKMVIFNIFCLLLIVPSIALHETVHVVISFISPYDEPTRLEIMNLSDFKKTGSGGSVYTKKTCDEIPGWYYPFHEAMGYSIQLHFLVLLSLYLTNRTYKYLKKRDGLYPF